LYRLRVELVLHLLLQGLLHDDAIYEWTGIRARGKRERERCDSQESTGRDLFHNR
jgi:hypothetical protein